MSWHIIGFLNAEAGRADNCYSCRVLGMYQTADGKWRQGFDGGVEE